MKYIFFLIGFFLSMTINAQQTQKEGFPPVRTADIAKRTNVVASIPIKTGGDAQSQKVVEAISMRKVDATPNTQGAGANSGTSQNKPTSPGLPSSFSVRQVGEQLQKQNDSTKADLNVIGANPEKNK
jgi:hypothetical protein